MASDGRLIQLTELLSTKVKAVHIYIRENNLPDPSFDASYPPVFDLPLDVDVARKAALEALDELRSHLLGPLGTISESVTSRTSLVSLHAITHFNMANVVPVGSTCTIPEIAEKCNIHPNDAETIIRHGLTYRLFKQQPDGSIAHSAATRAITTAPHFQGWVTHALGTMWKTTPFIVSAMEKWPGSQEINETAFNLAHGTVEPFFKAMSQDKTRVQNFSEAMKFWMSNPTMKPEFAIDGYAWDSHAQGTVVDVGGSHGIIALKLAERYPAMKIIVQDRPEVVASAPKTANNQVEFQSHDFFKEQPIKGADVYFYRYIFHSWSDKYCLAILRALVPALKDGSKVLIMDHIVPESGALSPYQERPFRAFDIGMKEAFNSKERSESDWRKMLGNVDERFRMADILRSEGSQLSIIVVECGGGGTTS
ncbi:S-adenosyl-L-methionine-dependent methyltransferase [Clohesyomyces aquaticus]|uniref:S-adenosyl-L-methionine-dependent methyltransferase n=1 Tax=Clohesyomyces aquaticus TaxID=1231657 RepID=A0A1Y1ZHU1_9PLEO|nr:S-adenosyl-L-methionine-dependent methyltransferase [Clohesyomyces aquaticus]